MIDALLSRASTRFIFVVGKGGVGKTTTASAVALALADAQQTVHLISTDPAHSVADIFQQHLGSGAVTSNCNDALLLEEFSARKYADQFFAEARAPLVELIERGSYLDANDAASFLDLSIPGIDEVMSALRLVELSQSNVQHIVVDTAPTGHTIRLLDSAPVIGSWAAAGSAMVEKAGAVATRLVGQPVPLAAQPLLEEWADMAHRFEQLVLRSASAIIVTRGGTVVSAETDRLTQQLRERGLPIAATVALEGDARGTFAIPRMPDAIGCAALREWREQLQSPGSGPSTPRIEAQEASAAPNGDAARWIEQLDANLIWVVGKGGVGKSTCAGAIATELAAHRKVCIVSTDPAGSLSEVLAQEVSSEVRELSPNLFALQIDAPREFARMREQYRDSINQIFASLGMETAAQLDRRVLESLWDFAPPGIDEIIALIEILERAPDYDVLVVDSAPTGHFLRLIEMPEIALAWVHSLLRMLVKYGAVGSLDALATDLLGFSKRLRQLKLDLSTVGKTAAFVVTLPEAMVHAETTRLLDALQRGGVPVTATILNRAYANAHAQEQAPVSPGVRLIIAPNQEREVVGLSALRSFLARWSIYGE